MAKVKMPSPEDLGNLTEMFKVSGLKEKLLFTLVILLIFRLGIHIPLGGINLQAFADIAKHNNFIGFLDFFAGGGILKVSIFALGIGPYITASIIMQLLTAVIPKLEELQKEEGDAGRRIISQYTRYFTVVLAVFQSVVFMTYMSNAHLYNDNVNPIFFNITSIVSLVTGAVFVMWLGELISEKGVGNGASLLIFFGIVSRIPQYTSNTMDMVIKDASKQLPLLIMLAIFVATVVFVIIMQNAVRKVIIVNAKRQVGNKIYGGGNTHIPFKINPGGVMPIIFAVAILMFPQFLISALGKIPSTQVVADNLSLIFSSTHITYYFIYFGLIVFLTFFYASIMPNMQPKDIANNLKKYGSAIPGIKPGKPTADLLDTILSRVTLIGAVGLGLVALIPGLATHLTGIDTLSGIGATALIIIVGVALDTVNQIRTHMLARQYEGFLRQ